MRIAVVTTGVIRAGIAFERNSGDFSRWFGDSVGNWDARLAP